MAKSKRYSILNQKSCNIIEVVHQRLFDAPSVQAAELELMIEARDPAHADAITAALAGSYEVRRV